ncbi:MAG TPA: aminotransferase class III-fold pyridoxal phosphate-dependent enzyme [Pseudonocardiaceae bacterium]|jgi:adenosylmethionine-8-amino-7-oxononanoate aminotransferase|nr:aminotransferase class III-fold pyridoxal phosphate-dependent enzyme [Pseudonocardiaceae bacterium]
MPDFDGRTYHLWHGVTPWADFVRTADPDRFLTEGRGSHVRDRAGRWYLDARSSMWHVTLGYSCEPVKAAMRRQLDTLPTSTVLRFEQPPQVAVDYAAALAAALPAPLNHVRFGSTGTQMTEQAVMLSRFYRRMHGEPDRCHAIGLYGSYHGSGPLATALSGVPVMHDYSAPVDSHVGHIPRPDGSCGGDADCDGSCVRPLVELIDRIGADLVTAVIVEPVLGTYVQQLTGHYLRRVTHECRTRGIHVIADEVTTGMGRTGALTATERVDIVPDMVVLGKGISAGYFPLAALVVADSIFDALAAPEHRLSFPNGSTSDGHPLGMAAGLAVLDVLTAPGFLAGVDETGRRLADCLAAELSDVDAFGGVQGAGLMLAVDLVHDDGTPWTAGETDRLRLACADNGLLTSYAPGILPLLPPLTLTDDECGELAAKLGTALRDIAKASA